MAAPCAPLGSLLTYLPLAPSTPVPHFATAACRCLSSPPRGTIGPYVLVSVPSSLHKRVACSSREGERKRGGERKARDGKKSKKEIETPGNPPGSNHRREERAKWLFTSILSPISEPRCQNRFRKPAFRLCRMMYVVEGRRE